MTGLIAELKRRNVFRMGVLYVLGAWLILQVADVLVGLFALPEWSLRFVGFVLLLGLPIALVFSWIYELTPDGLRRDRGELNPSGDGAARRMNGAIVLLVLVALGAYAWDRFAGDDPAPEPPAVSSTEPAGAPGAAESPLAPVDRSVAVLPFENLSADPEQAHFVDGLTEEILNRLAHLPELLVTARTSSFQFRDSALGVPEIAARLGVAHVVEGSVRRFGDRLRVTAQLIRAADGFHVWSENYDREVTDLFEIQDDIAEQIARALDVYLDEERRRRIERIGTRKVEAFELWVRAGRHFDAYHLQEDDAGLRRANELLDQAIAIDPGFWAAWLFRADLYAHFLFADPVSAPGNYPEGLDEASAYAALQENMLRAEEYAIGERARLYTRIDRLFLSGDWNELPVQVRRLAALIEDSDAPPAPNQWAEVVATTVGRHDLGVAITDRNLARDPLARFSYVEANGARLHAGDIQGALDLVAQARRLTGDHASLAELEAKAHLFADDPAAALAALDRFATETRDSGMRVWALAALGRCTEAADAAVLTQELSGGADSFLFAWIDAWLGRDESLVARVRRLDESPIAGALFARVAWSYGPEPPWDLALMPRVVEQFRQAGNPLRGRPDFVPLCELAAPAVASAQRGG